jgi:alkanesulfonate monooxygenase SsuD/methylene tetrahydromethanopterin reductase-like flavin-dependent oxidoreductase (luciferase family)
MRPTERQLGAGPATGLALRDPYRWADLAGLARWAEVAGFDTLFLPEVGARDTLVTLGALAGETSTIRLATGVAPLPARSPSLLAMAGATVQERSHGRLVLGLGTGPSGPGALGRLRATVLAVREAFAVGTGRVGEVVAATSLRLDAPPPIWVAALGPRAVRLGAEVADGVLLNWCTPRRVAEARVEIDRAARAAGREPGDVAVGVYVRVALVKGAERTARSMAAEYAAYPSYGRQFAAMGIDPADPDGIARELIVSDAAEGPARLDAYRAAGADLPVVYPLLAPGPPDPAAARETLAPFAH